jgi:hypothetical protein
MAELLPERLFGDIGRSARGKETRFSPDRIADLRNITSRTGEVATLDCHKHPDWCPMLITFADEGNPVSVARADASNLATALGPGVRLQRITVKVTDDDVTTGIDERLRWLPQQQGALQKIPLSERPPIGTPLPLSAHLTERDFAQGILR